MSSRRKASREAILEAAQNLLGSNGTAITLEQVAQAAGVSRQAIYLHFQNRSELVLGVADRAREEAGIVNGELGGSTPRELLESFVSVVARLHESSADSQLAIEALCRTDADLATRWLARPVGRTAAARELARRLSDGGATTMNPKRAADLVWALAGPSLFYQLVSQRGWSTRAYKQCLVAMLLEAVVTSAADKPLRVNGRKKK